MHITGHRLLLTLDAALEAAGHRRYGRAKTIAVALVTGRRHHVYTTGCLCSLVPEYARHNKWRHGWAVVEVHAGAATVTLHHP